MTRGSLAWALIIVADRSTSAAGTKAVLDPPAIILERALSLTSIAKTGCLIEDHLRPPWSGVVRQLWPVNVFALPSHQPVVDVVIERLEAISLQEPDATIILIPFNHCAVEELKWLDSARGALRLGAANQNTVYCLHDNPDNDPRSALKKPDVCTSSVLVGSVTALLALCRGKQATAVVELVVDQPTEVERAMSTDAVRGAGVPLPLNLVHIRLVEEYARLQRQDVWHRKSSQIDVHA